VSEENEKRLREAYALWNRHDFDALWEYIDPSIEIDATGRVLNPAHYSGLDGFRRLTEEVLDVWETWSIEPRAFRWDGDRVLVDIRVTARGRGSGVELAEDEKVPQTV
jgi:SnoaL-like protein